MNTVEELVARTRVAQGLPPAIEDPAALRRIATALREGTRRARIEPQTVP